MALPQVIAPRSWSETYDELFRHLSTEQFPDLLCPAATVVLAHIQAAGLRYPDKIMSILSQQFVWTLPSGDPLIILRLDANRDYPRAYIYRTVGGPLKYDLVPTMPLEDVVALFTYHISHPDL